MNSLLERAISVFDIEINTLNGIRNSLDDGTFNEVINLIMNSSGKVVFMGMGKSGHIARKISATMASLGTSSFFVHPGEAAHGDLGMIQSNDVLITISNSGETEEILQLFPSLKIIGAKIVAITSNKNSTLAKNSDISVVLDIEREACIFDIAPTSSTTATLVYGDALAVTLSEIKDFNKEEFGVFHPKGTIGKRILTKVSDLMHSGEENPILKIDATIRDALLIISKKAFGLVNVVDKQGKLIGIITAGDIIRKIDCSDEILNNSIETIVNTNPITIREDLLAVTAINKIKEAPIKLVVLPVVNEENICTGVLSVNDLIKERII